MRQILLLQEAAVKDQTEQRRDIISDTDWLEVNTWSRPTACKSAPQ